MLKIFIRRLAVIVALSVLFIISKFLSFGPLMGILKGKILATQVILPLLGAFTGGISLLLISTLYTILYSPFKLSLYFISSVYHIPSFFAALSFGRFNSKKLAINSGIINYLIPLICSIAFIAHPVGSFVPFYTLYWGVPVLVQYFNLKSIFARSLAATFVAHALGTVFFIYSFDTDISFWVNLSKIVWLERLVLAASMSSAYLLINYLVLKFKALSQINLKANILKNN